MKFHLEVFLPDVVWSPVTGHRGITSSRILCHIWLLWRFFKVRPLGFVRIARICSDDDKVSKEVERING